MGWTLITRPSTNALQRGLNSKKQGIRWSLLGVSAAAVAVFNVLVWSEVQSNPALAALLNAPDSPLRGLLGLLALGGAMAVVLQGVGILLERKGTEARMRATMLTQELN
jgi:hypothetical protein